MKCLTLFNLWSVPGNMPGGVFRSGVHGEALVGGMSLEVHGLLGPPALRSETNLYYRWAWTCFSGYRICKLCYFVFLYPLTFKTDYACSRLPYVTNFSFRNISVQDPSFQCHDEFANGFEPKLYPLISLRCFIFLVLVSYWY